MEISLDTILSVLRKCIALMIILALVAGIGAYFVSEYLITPTYTAVAKINVVTSKDATSASEANTGTSYITKILKTCTQLLQANSFVQGVKEELAVDYVPRLVFESSEDSTIILIKAYDSDPKKACDIASVAATRSTDYISDMTSGMATVKIYDNPIVPVSPSSPNSFKNSALAALAVAAAVFVIYLLAELLGTKVKSEKELSARFPEIPIIAAIPDFYYGAKNSKKYYSYDKYGYSYGNYGGYGNYAVGSDGSDKNEKKDNNKA